MSSGSTWSNMYSARPRTLPISTRKTVWPWQASQLWTLLSSYVSHAAPSNRHEPEEQETVERLHGELMCSDHYNVHRNVS